MLSHSISMPKFIYGTAWKAERTASLCENAILSGFRGIDTAGQPKHYNERGVGEALQKLKNQSLAREELFLQSKFTPLGGHDPLRIPYDPRAPLPEQVAVSFASSLENLGTDYLDSYLLHSPLATYGETLLVWRSFEELIAAKKVRQIGISNIYDLSLLQKLYSDAKVKPTIVQNRFYQTTHYDKELRRWSINNGVIYQSFWTLTANPHILGNRALEKIAVSKSKTPEQIFFRFLTKLDIVPLTGTTSAEHMKQDLSIFDFDLSQAEMEICEKLLG